MEPSLNNLSSQSQAPLPQEMQTVSQAWSALEQDDREDIVPNRLLNQDEIDSLLGMDRSFIEEQKGLKLLLDSKAISYERLPMLEVVFDRLVRLLSTSLRNMMSENVEISLTTLTSIRFGEYLNTITMPSLIGVVRAEEWENSLLLVSDTSLTYSIVDVLLGGRKGTIQKFEGRAFTTIEQNLIERLFKFVLQDASKSFHPVCDINFNLERIETNQRFATIVRPVNAAILIKLKIDMEGRGGYLDFVFPYATLEPIREQLLQMFRGEKFGQDAIWEQHLGQKIWGTQVQLEAVMDELPISLKEIMNWKVGSQIIFKTRPTSEIRVRCGETDVFCGYMGQRNGNVAIQVDKNKIQGRQNP